MVAVQVALRRAATPGARFGGPGLLQGGNMCGRVTQKSNPKVLGLRIANLVEPLYAADVAPRYNGAPGQQHWGLIPNWTKETSPKNKPINATAERVASAPMFRGAYAKRRCLVPVDSFSNG